MVLILSFMLALPPQAPMAPQAPAVPVVIIPKSASGSWLTNYATAMSRPGPYLIVIHTDNCLPCRRLDAEFPREGFPGWTFLKLHSSDPIVRELGVKAYPTVILAAKDGTIIRHDAGTVGRQELERRMRTPQPIRYRSDTVSAAPAWCIGGS